MKKYQSVPLLHRKMKYLFNKSYKGMSIVELITGMSVVGVIVSSMAAIIATSVTTLKTVDIRKDLVMNGYYASSKFVREFREIDQQTDVLVADSTTVRFIVADTLTVEYKLTNSRLTRLIVGNLNSSVMTAHVDVSKSYFNYWDNTQTVLTGVFLPSAVWRARITLTMTDYDTDVVFAADVFPEDFK